MMTETVEQLAPPATCTALAQRVLIVLAAADQAGLPVPRAIGYQHDTVGLRVDLHTEADYTAWRGWLEPAVMGNDYGMTRTFRFAYGQAYDVPVMLNWMATEETPDA